MHKSSSQVYDFILNDVSGWVTINIFLNNLTACEFASKLRIIPIIDKLGL